MLMEKAGKAFFYIDDLSSNKTQEVTISDYLSVNQEKMMATQPDMMVQFAHFLKSKYEEKGFINPKVRVECYVTLNGSGSKLFIDKNIDLAKQEDSFAHKTWILPFEKH
jgi:hypothetical protein